MGRPSIPQVERVCEHCSQIFYASAKRVGRGLARFCSSRCWHTFRIQPVEVRFWKYVAKSDDPNACWPWTGSPNNKGYGVIGKGPQENKGLVLAHCLSYKMHYGPIPEGLEICHSCDNPPCVNPNHLRADTHSENCKDAYRRGRRNQASR